MNTFGKIALTIACLVACVAADCYREIGCSNKVKGKYYRYGQRWRPKSDPCHTCKCIKAKKFVLECEVAVEDKPFGQMSVKKSQYSARFETQTKPQVEDENIEITQKEAATKECAPTKAPTFDLATMTFEPITYKTVYYYYTRKVSRCCSRFMNFTNVHPACKVVKISKCRSKVVQVDNPRQRCFMSMSMLG